MNTIINDDCLHAMAAMQENSIDTIITDPPYGLEFMGKEWDTYSGTGFRRLNNPSDVSRDNVFGRTTGRAPQYFAGTPYQQYMTPIFAGCLRVAKPGAMMLVFGGTRTYHRLACAIEDAGWEIRDCLMWLYGSGFPKSLDIGKAAGNGWQGWGTALKPAWEPILLAMKPCDGTYADNATKYGVAGLNIDGSRLKCGRWPANVILDENAVALLDRQTGILTSGSGNTRRKKHVSVSMAGSLGDPRGIEEVSYGDSGGASRFFYCAKASRKDRGEGNTHPTVKPLELMRYLVRLTKTPIGGIVLDPFAGSGSTGLACEAEGRDCILIEQDAAYCDIMRRRSA